MNPIRVLMVTSEWPKPGVNVTSHFIKRQAEFLSAAGVDVTVFAFKGGKNPFNYMKNWVRLQTKVRREKYDLVHAQFGQSGLLALPKRLPLVVTFRGSDLLGTVSDKTRRHLKVSALHKFLSRQVAAHADAVIVVAEHMKSQLHASIDSHVIPSGLDLKLFRPTEKRIARTRLGLPQDEKLVLFVGRTNHGRKRGYLAQQAVEILNKSLTAELIIAWAIPHTDIPLYMSACDVLVFTSMQEGSPNVVKEALACNLPIVSVPVGDVESRIKGVEGCELCSDDNPETIAAALNRALVRGGRINGRETVLGLDENITTEQVMNIYQSVLTGRKAPAALKLIRRASVSR
ncbi:MAG TPA: glycosyltransferase [Pyrinomonadaceae bacterium]|nr:glycosyltransferase [Pyrinomonadaceae bacterium]